MEAIVEKMQGENGGVSVRTVKAFMSKVPSVFTGADLISWILKNLDVEDVTDAIHLAHLLSSHGYLFPIDDHQLTVRIEFISIILLARQSLYESIFVTAYFVFTFTFQVKNDGTFYR